VSRSGEAKEIVARLYDLLNAGDLDGIAALIADDAELGLKILPGAHNDPNWTYSGPAGFVEYAQRARQAEPFRGYYLSRHSTGTHWLRRGWFVRTVAGRGSRRPR
jgi:ketosteroid isomerase-like protein